MSELTENPDHMRMLKELLDKTETELYILDGGVDPALVQAHEEELARLTGGAGTLPEQPRTGPTIDQDGREVPQVTSGSPGSQIKTTMVAKELVEVEDLIQKLEKIKQKAEPDHKKRWEAYSLKIQGFTAPQIAESFGLSLPLIYQYWQWCDLQLPEVKELLEDFIKTSVQRLEAQYRQLAIARAKGDLFAHKVSLEIISQQSKMLGADKLHVDVDTTVTYKLVGVDLNEL